MYLTEKQKKKFWNYVDVQGPDDCWSWLSSKRLNGYGQFNIGSKGYGGARKEGAHRVSYFLNIGIVPDICRHTCDTKDCVNPAHLLNGTQKDNMRDMFERGRQPVFNQAGELNGNSRLTEDPVKEIRNRYLPYKVTLKTLAEEYGVSKVNIHYIVKGKMWT